MTLLPTVDIVIAAFNEERYIEKCLRALDLQDYPASAMNVFVVDDGSVDHTREIASRCGAHLIIARRQGPAAARNLGISKGKAELIGFLDGHCIPGRQWVKSIASSFEDQAVGGVQGKLLSRNTSVRVSRYLRHARQMSTDEIFKATVGGEKNIYPWIMSGNAMYRRDAIEKVRGFNEALVSCEDVDIAWRIFLLGYQLVYQPNARLVHHEAREWEDFLRKNRSYGAGAAQLTYIYKEHGAKGKFSTPALWKLKHGVSWPALNYLVGFNLESVRQSLGMKRQGLTPMPIKPVLDAFRGKYFWKEGFDLEISRTAVYWQRNPDTSVIVNLITQKRIVLRSSGHFIWRLLTEKWPRQLIAAAVEKRYRVESSIARNDIDDLVKGLLEEQILIITKRGEYAQATSARPLL